MMDTANSALSRSKYSGFILMEYVDGTDLEEYVKSRPDQVNEMFVQAIDGFSYLERTGILHRDIRPGNLLVSRDGNLKIIDLGFGKRVVNSTDFDKSITLNWWCQTPNEFLDGRYDFTTEVYFVGKLFERLIQENNLTQFKHIDILQRMCKLSSAERIKSFAEVDRYIRSDQFTEIDFSEEQIEAYRDFTRALTSVILKIAQSAKYETDLNVVQGQLSEVYRASMLEEWIPEANRIIGCFVEGQYYYKSRVSIGVGAVRDFLRLLKSSSVEQASIIMANIHTRLDSIKRYDPDVIDDDDIPF